MPSDVKSFYGWGGHLWRNGSPLRHSTGRLGLLRFGLKLQPHHNSNMPMTPSSQSISIFPFPLPSQCGSSVHGRWGLLPLMTIVQSLDVALMLVDWLTGRAGDIGRLHRHAARPRRSAIHIQGKNLRLSNLSMQQGRQKKPKILENTPHLQPHQST